MEVLFIKDTILPTTTLTSDFLGQIDNVTELSLIEDGITEIAEGAFCQISNLTQLDLTRNTITPTPNMFECLESLLVLELPSNGITELPEDVFKPLKNLRVLQLWGNRLKTLPAKIFEPLSDLRLLELTANQLEVLPSGVFDALVNLQQLSLNYNKIKLVPSGLFATTLNLKKVRWGGNVGLQLAENTFANLEKLESVSLVANGLVVIPESLFKNSANVQSVSLSRNRLETIPVGLLHGLTKLKTLDLSHNRIKNLEDGSFDSLKSLETLFLEDNQISVLSRQLFDALFELRTLRLDYNRLATLPNFISQRNLKALNASHNQIKFDENMFGVSPLNQCPALEELDLSFNEIDYFDSDFMIILVQLRMLDLSFNRIESIQVDMLERMDTHERRINLSNNNITYVDFEQAEIMARLQGNIDTISSNSYNTVVLLATNPIACDCNAYDLWRYYNYKLDPKVPTLVTILKDEVRCANTDYLIAEIPPKYFTCNLEDIVTGFECPENCTCNWIPDGKEIVYNCANATLQTPPPIKFPPEMLKFDALEVDLKYNQLKTGPTPDTEGYTNVTRLLLSHNEIERLDWLPPRLEVLKLDYNYLSGLNYSVMKSLNGSSSLKSLTLDHNPWTCSCSALNLTKFVLHRVKQVSVFIFKL